MSLTYVLFSFLAAGSSALVALNVWSRRSVTGANALIVLMAAAALWAFFSGLTELVPLLATKFLLIRIYFLSIVFVPVAMLVLAMQYTGHERWVTRRLLILLGVVPAVTIAIV